jgi:hypothetical protein
MWSDNETSRDLIGFGVHADLIEEVVTDQLLLPVTLGVFADWGNGKTSIMRMLSEKLSKKPDIAVIYFDAWLFEGYDDAKSALLSAIITQLSENENFPAELKSTADRLIKKVNWMRMLKMGWDHVALPAVLAYATGGATAVPSLLGMLGSLVRGGGEKEEVDSEKSIIGSEALKEAEEKEGLETDVRTFRKEFGQLLKDSKFKSLVVMIDDLDRCSPERIVENLEAIKLFLNVDGSAFVIGADLRIISHAVSIRYSSAITAASEASKNDPESAANQLIRDYVEKLIQIPYHLPRLSPAEVETYMTLLFSERHLDKLSFATCLEGCNALRRKNRFTSFGLAAVVAAVGEDKVNEELRTTLNFVAGGAQLITENLKGNPRQVKRFLNAFILRQKLAKVAQISSCKDEVLLKLMLLEYSNSTRFRELARWQEDQNGRPAELRALENEDESAPQGWEGPKLRRWASMVPLLSEVDLSDYFWLARDKLGASISGLSLVPPAVRAALEALMSVVGRKTAGAMINSLDSDELDLLMEQIKNQLRRDPSNGEGYNAALEFITLQDQYCRHLLEAIGLLPSKTLPGWLTGKLNILKRGDLKSQEITIDTLITKLAEVEGSKAATAESKRKKN